MVPSPPDAIDTATIRRVLVTKLRHHGDVLLTSPVFTTLGRALPRAEIDGLVYRETAPMLEGHPALAILHTIDRNAKASGPMRHLRAERTLLKALRARGYDLLVHLTEHPRGALLARLLRPRHAVARERTDANALWRSSFTHFYRLPRTTPRHTVECNLDALRRLGIQPTAGDKRLVLEPGTKAQERIAALLRGHGLEHGTFVQAHPGSRWLFKCWPPQRSAAMIGRVVERGFRVVLTGAPDPRERELVAAVVAALSPGVARSVVDLSGELSLPELAALAGSARAFFGVDSAPMHIAAAMRIPVIALFGPSGEQEWGPWQVPHRVVASSAHPCRPCGIDGCGGGKVSECLTSLEVDAVAAAFDSLLAETAGAPSLHVPLAGVPRA